MTLPAGVQGEGFATGVATGDLDNDGREHLFVAARPGGTVPQHLAGQESLAGAAAEGPPLPVPDFHHSNSSICSFGLGLGGRGRSGLPTTPST